MAAQRYGVHGTFVTEEGAVTIGEMLERVLEETALDAQPWTAPMRSPLPQDRRWRHLGRRSARRVPGATRAEEPQGGAAGGDRLACRRNAAVRHWTLIRLD